MKNIGIYIHIPFCISKCNYCSFTSFANKEYYFEKYTNTLISEIQNKDFLKEYVIKSIYLGGGTPTVLDTKYILKILKQIYKYDVSFDAEITIEANPKTVNLDKLKILRENNINRISFGVQSDDDKILNKLGRLHTYSDFLQNFYSARQVGFDNINIDLMFGLPAQNLEKWALTLQNILKLDPEHISAYSLSIEEGTIFNEMHKKKLLKTVDDGVDRSMYHYLTKVLTSNNYQHYEISNFAKQNFQSVHNNIYWRREEYVGIGLDAHSFVNNTRFSNTKSLDKYISGSYLDLEKQYISKRDAMEEYIFLGLRLLKGIDVEKFNEKFQEDFYSIYGEKILELKKMEFIGIYGNNIKLTSKGIDVSNLIFEKILT